MTPGGVEEWTQYQNKLQAGLELLDPESDGINAPPYSPTLGFKLLREVIDLDTITSQWGLTLTEEAANELLGAVAGARYAASNTLIARAQGDYSPDPIASTFPEVDIRAELGAGAPPTPKEPKGEAGDWESVFNLWAKEHDEAGGAAPTRNQWQTLFKRFAETCQGRQPSDWTVADVGGWVTMRLASGLSPTTIRKSDLPAIQAILGEALAKEHLEPPPVCRRPFGLSYAAIAGWSSMA